MRFLLLFFLLSYSFVYSQSWQSVGGGTNNSSHGMLVWNGKLVNLGSYNNPCNRVATWDGTQWECLGGGVGIVARAGTVWNGNLVVVGDFWNNFQPCTGCNGIAMWDGTSWTALGNGFNNDVLTVTVYNGDLIVGGDFTQADGVACNRVVRYNSITNSFESMGAVTDMDNDVRCMTVYDGELWVGGDFNNVGGNPPSDGLVKWDETTSSWVGGNSGVDLIGGVNETVRVLYVNPNDDNLYMGGEFPELHDGDAAAEDFNMAGVAMYDGSNWYPLGTGLNEYCRAIHEYNGDLIVGGYFTMADGVSCNKIAKWNTTTQTFSPMGQGFDGVGIDEYVKSAVTWNGIFFAGGAYTQAEGGPMNYIAQWYEAPSNPPSSNFSSSSNGICEGECIQVTESSTGSPTSWTWTCSGASIASPNNQDPGNICFPTSGTYTLELQACNSNGCDIYTETIDVIATPTISTSNITICDGQSATINTTVSSTGGNYFWAIDGSTASSLTVSPALTTDYTVEYEINGCAAVPATSTVTVNPTPMVSVNNTSICEGDLAFLTATPSITGGDYYWTEGGEITSDISVSPVITTNYEIQYTLNGCTAIAFGVVDVTPTPTVSVSNISICAGETATLTSTVSPSGGDYYWTFDNSIGSSLVVSPTTTSSYDLNYSLNGCPAQTASGTVSVNDFPVISITDGEICEGESFSITSTVDIPGGDYSWSTTEVTDNIIVSPTTTTVYDLDYTVNGCSANTSSTITVNSLPDNSIYLNNLTLFSNEVGGTYQWYDCGINNVIAGEINSSYTPSDNGSFAVIVSNSNCTDTSDCFVFNLLGIESISTETISISPNPFNDYITINNVNELTRINITDLQGRILYDRTTEDDITVNLEHLPAAIYIVALIQNNGTKSLKIVKD